MTSSQVPSDKDLLSALLEMTEFLYVQNILLRGLLRRAGVVGWKNKLDSAKDSAQASLAREDFQRTYVQPIRDQQELREVLEKFQRFGTVH
jgi:hypothetical protein